MFLMLPGSDSEANDEQSTKAFVLMFLTPSEIATFVSELQLLNV